MAFNINQSDIFIGKKVRLFRKKMGWGLKSLAAKLNMSIQQLQKYETSSNKISASLLYEISEIFEIPIGHFFENYKEIDSCRKQSKKGFNILLIEDNIDDELIIREAIADFPEKMNLYSIRDGWKALEFLRELNQRSSNTFIKPDIVLLELHLPKVNGIDILKSIKKDRFFNYIPVIVLSNSTTPDETLLSYNLQASGFIIKSCSYQEFKCQVYNALSYWAQLVKLPRG